MDIRNIDIKGQNVDFSLKRSARSKRLRIQLSLENGLEVVAPKRMSERQIFNFISKKQNWIYTKIRYFDKLAKSSKRGEDEIYYLGQLFKLQIENGEHNKVEFDGINFRVVLSKNSNLKQVLEAWYRKEAHLNLVSMTTQLAEEYGYTINSVTIRHQKTRWGSCSGKGNINYNYRLIMAPEDVIRYVVIHELSHLSEMNHSRAFWRLVAERCPDYKIHKQWLKRQGHILRV